MKKYLILIALGACGPAPDSITYPEPIKGSDGINGKDGLNGEDGQDGINGQNGQDGSNGSNGLGLASQSRAATSLECPANSGSAVDIYLDVDGSGTVTAGDTLQSGLVACNGSNGSNGSNAVASVTGFNFTNLATCVDLGFNLSGRKSSSTSSNVRLYPNSTCQGSHINELSEGGDEIYQVSDSVIFILEGNNSGSIAPLTIRRLVFNL